jgi:large subunit ribosomal protein L17
MITLAKRGDVSARRQALSYMMTREAVDKLFDTIGPRFGDRQGGYLRIIRGGFRKGDGGEIAFIELLGSEKFVAAKRKKSAEVRSKRVEAAKKVMEENQAEAEAEAKAASKDDEEAKPEAKVKTKKTKEGKK